MALQSLPRSAESYSRTQREEIGAAVKATSRLWKRMGDDFDASLLTIAPEVLRVWDVAQERMTAGALEYVPAVLEETGQRRALTARFEPNVDFLVGTAGDGLPSEGLLTSALIRSKAAVAEGASTAQALAQGGSFLTLAAGTLLSDTGRSAERVAAHARPVTGYVRMLNPPSCGRCVILAGKRSGNSTPFLRHPGCDCRNIPASESIGGDLTVDSKAYLDSLDDEALTKALGSRANAEAFRMGADQNQLINAYRRSGGVRPAQVYGRNVKYTTEGVTRRGLAYRRMSQADYLRTAGEVRTRAGASMRAATRLRAPRLMPESILQIATSKADADRLLRLYGWIL